MLIPLDQKLYSDNCRVLEIVPGSLFVFPIFKNASSSIEAECIKQNGKVYINDEIKELKNITVYVRDPVDRLQSGIATICNNLKKEYTLDTDTIIFFLTNYLFLDVHLLPQFNWLLNLRRFASSETLITFDDYKSVNKLTEFKITPKKIEKIIDVSNLQYNLHLQLDTILYNLVGQTLTFDEIMHRIKTDPDAGYAEISKLPKILGTLL